MAPAILGAALFTAVYAAIAGQQLTRRTARSHQIRTDSIRYHTIQSGCRSRSLLAASSSGA
jgi:hypothetical protein